MSNIMQIYDYSPELLQNILSVIDRKAERDLTERIVRYFIDAGLTVKVKHIFYDKPWAYFRVMCYIKKSAEAVIINTKTDLGKEGVVDGMAFQLRISNTKTFEELDKLSENVRNQIVNANDCGYCSAKCEGKRHTFSYNGTDHVKCHFICSNFRFADISEIDIASIMAIIKNEFDKIKK